MSRIIFLEVVGVWAGRVAAEMVMADRVEAAVVVDNGFWTGLFWAGRV